MYNGKIPYFYKFQYTMIIFKEVPYDTSHNIQYDNTLYYFTVSRLIMRCCGSVQCDDEIFKDKRVESVEGRGQKSFAEGGGETESRPSSAPSGTRSLSDVNELSKTMGLWDRVGGMMGVLEEQGDAEKMGKCTSNVSSASLARLSDEADRSKLFWYAEL